MKKICFSFAAVILFLYLIPMGALGDSIGLTSGEKAFIEEHPVIRLGVDPSFIPYEFIDTDGEYKGIAADYILLISQLTGLSMEPEKGLTWSEAYVKAVERELDVLPCVSKTAGREKYFLFSDAYYTFQRVIFLNVGNTSVTSFEDLRGRNVAVQADSSHHSYLTGYDDIFISLYDTVPEALRAVSDGREEAFIGNLTTTSYLAKTNGMTNLKYISIPSESPQGLYLAVRKDWPELVSILNKALSAIGREARIDINNKWVSVQTETDYSKIIRAVVIVGAVIALVLAVSFFWIMRLRREIAIRKKAQEELKAAKEEAEQANQIKSLFLARMSHEIRTPLSAITGMSYLIKKTGVTVTQGMYLEKLNQSARNMLGVINDILDFSKIESGKMEIEIVSFELDKLLQRILNILSVRVQEKGIEFNMNKSPGMPSYYLGDPVRIEQILINLLSNAVKFTDQGSVTLIVRSVRREQEQSITEFTVRDTGIGMQKEQVSRLFIPFDQGDSSISRRFGGTGLGLSIVKSLTDMMNGEINVISEMNKGSIFTIRLPLAVDTAKEQMNGQSMTADCFLNIRALVLDKSESAPGIASCLESFGIASSVCASEEEAVHVLHDASKEDDRPYNLLVVDYQTPRKGGIVFAGKARKLSFVRQPVKCILLVPMAREDLIEEAEAAGIEFSVVKPVIPSVLYNGIVEIFEVRPPKNDPQPAGQVALAAPYPYHILLAEDNKTNQFIAKTILEQAGFQVSIAENGREACEFFAENQKSLDLILMDIHMPVMDGYAASDIIRETDSEIPIVAMTADAIAGIEEKCSQHGIYHYVSKPFEPEAFIATILELLKVNKPRAIQAEEQAGSPGDGPVLDLDDGLRRLGGSEEIYRMVLREYREETSGIVKSLTDFLKAGDFDAAAQAAHKMKGSSGSVGARRLQEAAAGLQKSLQANDEKESERLFLLFYKLYRQLEYEADAYLDEGITA